MGLLLKSKSCYEQFKKHSLQVLPSVSHLQKLAKGVSRKEGVDPKVCGWLADELQGESGQLLFDEMKLVGDIHWNVSDDSVAGFAATSTKTWHWKK